MSDAHDDRDGSGHADDGYGGDDHGHGHGHGDEDGRTTAPMSEFTGRQAGIGAVVALVGLAVAFGVPLALTL